MSEFREKTIAGVSWNLVGQIGRQGALVVSTVVLANLLSPREFGLLAMITIITRFAELVTELGLGSAIVQRKELDPVQLSSVFWVNLGTGVGVTALLMAGAPAIGAFYGEPLLVPLTLVVSTTFLLNSLGIIPRTLCTRRIDFRTVATVETAASVLAGGTAIYMAYTDWGVWSLAGQEVVRAGATSGFFFLGTGWRPSFRLKWGSVRKLLGFSLHLTGDKTFNYWTRQADDLLIGKYVGSDPLGVYRLAYDVMLFPLRSISHVISRVLFPSLSAIQEQKGKVKAVFLKMTRSIAFVTFPLMLGLLATTRPFVLAVFGESWSGMIPILMVFAPLGMTQSIGTLTGNLFLSQGRTDLQFRLGLFVKPFKILAIVVGLQWGALGVAIGYAVASWIFAVPIYYVAGGLVDLSVGEVIRYLAPVFGTAVLMGALVYGVGLTLPVTWPHWAALAVQVPCGIVLYGAMVVLFDLEAYRDLRGLLEEQWAERIDR